MQNSDDVQKAYDSVHWKALKGVLKELRLPSLYVECVMIRVTTVTYKYNVGGRQTQTLEARRGLRQGDSISPLLFVLVMEYLNRCLEMLKQVSPENARD